MSETLDSLFRNVNEGDTIKHKETGNKAEVVGNDEILTTRGREKGLEVDPEDEDRTLFLAQSLAEEWKVIDSGE